MNDVATSPEELANLLNQQQQSGNNGNDVVTRAAAARVEAEEWLAQQQQERDQLKVMLTEATLQIDAANRRATALQLDNVELRNNLQAMASTCEDLRQEASDLRAFFSSIRAQLEHFEIPLPIRKRAHKLKPPNGEAVETNGVKE